MSLKLHFLHLSLVFNLFVVVLLLPEQIERGKHVSHLLRCQYATNLWALVIANVDFIETYFPHVVVEFVEANFSHLIVSVVKLAVFHDQVFILHLEGCRLKSMKV